MEVGNEEKQTKTDPKILKQTLRPSSALEAENC